MSRGHIRSVIPLLIFMLHQSSTWNLLGHRASPKKPLSSKADVASAVYMPECSRTARILDHSGVDLQGVAQLIYNSKPSPSIPVFWTNLRVSHAHPTSCGRSVPARLLTSNQAFDNENRVGYAHSVCSECRPWRLQQKSALKMD